ncbi:hypothetical protein B0H66DRAFT_602924 [Apodospora peruviana]|uniref:Uncharacterized protein n=1 Tax=Apodospora peruviana TaxID=516989 RepID=A0AAE0I4N3_9PEZI|nr:hypothetical protein B0H66DRAFT_602924 [Apodospora peruviana]
MALLNPVHGLVVPFLCFFTIPLAILAGITTTLAFTVLMFRVAVVYLDIALAMIPQYVITRSRPRGVHATTTTTTTTALHTHRRVGGGNVTPISAHGSSSSSGSGYSTPSPVVSPFPSGPGNNTTTGYIIPGHRSPGHRRKTSYGFGAAAAAAAAVRHHSRRSSQASLASLGTISPIHEGRVTPAIAAESGLTPSVGIDRDFEGIGGWRLDDRDDSDWANINSRLELPLERSSAHNWHHQRSQSAGPTTPGEAVTWLMMKATTPKNSSEI